MRNKGFLISQYCILSLFYIFFFHSLYSYPMRPIPWVTHEAFCFLENFMLEKPNATILEFGSGSSTIWFAKRTRNLISVDHNPKWYQHVSNLLSENSACYSITHILHECPYYTICDDFPDEHFDLILVDGRNRNGCIVNSIRILKRGGILMLDNAERPYYQKSLELLKDWKATKTTQKEPDSCGFTYPGWQTHWYIKP